MNGRSAATGHGTGQQAGESEAQTHRIVLVVEVDEPTELSPADLVALADVLRDAAAELAPHGTTRASIELGVNGADPPSPRSPSDDLPQTA